MRINIHEKALEVFDRGWIQGHYTRPEGHCVVGCYAQAVQELFGPPSVVKETKALEEFVKINGDRLPLPKIPNATRQDAEARMIIWNDKVERQPDEVREAIKLTSEAFELGEL